VVLTPSNRISHYSVLKKSGADNRTPSSGTAVLEDYFYRLDVSIARAAIDTSDFGVIEQLSCSELIGFLV
jgi:hypothetical protein